MCPCLNLNKWVNPWLKAILMPDLHNRYNSLKLYHFSQTKGNDKTYVSGHESKQLLLKFTQFENKFL